MSQQKSTRCKTVFKETVLDYQKALDLYEVLTATIDWTDGIRSRNGFTRKAAGVSPGEFPDIDRIITTTLSKMTDTKYALISYYLNYYENGQMYTPNHSHKGTHQLVISLGATRTLKVAKNSFEMTNGSAVVFGSSTHGVPKDPDCHEGRISIATFMIPI